MKIHFHIENEHEYLHDEVCIIREMPFVPNIGDNIFITDEDTEKLENMAREYPDVYAHCYYYGSQGKENPNPEHLNLGDFHWVTDRCFKFEDNTIHITLNDK